MKYNFINLLNNLDFIDKIILFGSRARKDNTEKSDIDIAILCPNASIKEWSIVLEIIENADTLLKIDCVRLDKLKEKSELRQNIKKDGIILYEKTRI